MTGRSRNQPLISTSVMGVGVDFGAIDDVLAVLQRSIDTPPAPGSTRVAFLNANNANVAWRDAKYKQALADFDWVFADGIGVRLATFLSGVKYGHNLSGTDIVPAVLRTSRDNGLKVFLLGHTAEGIAKVVARFPALFPNVSLVGWHHGFFLPSQEAEVIDNINGCNADVLLVGMGTPKQEEWLHCNAAKLKPKLQIAVGGLFQYWSGDLTRAPSWVRLIRLEWFWIMCHQPHKWRRYLVGGPLFLARWFRYRGAP